MLKAIRVLPRVDESGKLVQLCLLNCSIGETGQFDISVRSGGKTETRRIANLAPWQFAFVE